MNKAQVDDWRNGVESRLEELTIMNAKQNSDIHYIKDSVDEIKNLVKEQNGRVRVNESAIARIQGVGGIIAIAFSGFIGWLFKLKG
ncbi:hypothetical protein HN682_09000 [Candidatus Peregrinibacteria bacterium]|jgi:hypothetical protein|nr:hypothetical protein [Candidatus Peregrinibacteria bacterium]